MLYAAMIICFIISFACAFVFYPSLIKYLKKLSFRQTVSEFALADDKEKEGTPMMGGVMFIGVPLVITTVFCLAGGFGDQSVVIVLLAFAGYGLIGFADDYLIAIKKNNNGLSPLQKLTMQLVLAVIFFAIYSRQGDLSLYIPLFGAKVDIGVWYFVLIVLMFAGASNAVNLTDGMDGLAGGCTFISLIPFLVFAVISNSSGICLFIISLMGALLAFLHYNVKPARVFMGDNGSLALGGALAAIALVEKKELVLILAGGIFVVETLCVIMQITSVKLRHKRVFLYTPIHYAFRIKGMPEKNVVRLFWIVEAVMAFGALLIGV